MHRLCLLLVVSLGCRGDTVGLFSGGGTPGAAGADLAPWSSCDPKPTESTGNDALVQTVPPPFGKNVSPATPVVAFLGQGVPLSAADLDGAQIMAGDEEVFFSQHTLDGVTGKAISLFPDQPFPSNVDVVVSIPVDGEEVEWSFHTGGYEVDLIDFPNFGFEEEISEQFASCPDELFAHTFYGFGDLVITDQNAGPAEPAEGVQHLLMSTGEILAGAAVGSTSTFVTSHFIQTGGADTLTLRTRFFAEEDSVPDGREDLLMLVLQGSDGARLVELGDSGDARDGPETSFPGLISARGGEEELHTVRNLGDLGAPLVLSLYLTDMGDPAGPSAVAVDDIQLN